MELDPATYVSRWVEFDAGHRVQTHNGKCRRPHGHRYRATVVCEGPVPGSGMVIDFGVLAEMLDDLVHDRWDHRFLVAADDTVMRHAIEIVDPDALVVLDRPPTAENLAADIGERFLLELPQALHLVKVDVRETPKSVASWIAPL